MRRPGPGSRRRSPCGRCRRGFVFRIPAPVVDNGPAAQHGSTATGEAPLELSRLGRRAFSALAGTTVLGLALGGSVSSRALPRSGARGPVPTGPPPGPPGADGRRHHIALDRYSLLVDGRRLALWSGEMHPFRLPSPSLWRDVLQKMRAYGYNAVDVRLAWNLHSPAPGKYDFTGVRDLDLFLRTAAETRMYVVLDPGPYIGADVDAGGLPGWLTAVEGAARTTDPAYLRHADDWLRRVNAIAARHQYSRGTGTVLLYRLDAPGRAGLTRLHEKIRAAGIDVPLLHADSPVARADSERTRDAAEARRVHLGHLAQGVTLHHVHTAFGGTSWGWLPAPSAPGPTYDPTAAIDEARRPTAKAAPLHQLGQLLRHVPDFTRLEEAAGVRAADDRLRVRHLANPDTGTHAYIVRNDSATAVTSTLPMGGTDVEVTVPGRDAKLFATGLHLGSGRRVAHANVQPMLSLSVGRLDVAAFVGRAGEMAHLVLDCPHEPWPTRLDEEAAWAYDHGKLHITVPLGENRLTRVRVRSGKSERTMILLFADDAASPAAVAVRDPVGPGAGARTGAAAGRRPGRCHDPADRRHRRGVRSGGVGAARHHRRDLERRPGGHLGQPRPQPAGHLAPARSARAGAARARRLAAPRGEPGVPARLRRLGVEGRRPRDVDEHHAGARGAAGALRRRLRLPLRRRLVPGPAHRRRGPGDGVAVLPHGRARDADGLAGRGAAGDAPRGRGRGAGHENRHGPFPAAGRPARGAPEAARRGCRVRAVGTGPAHPARPGRLPGGPRAGLGRLRGGRAEGGVADHGRGRPRPRARSAEPRRAVRGAARLAPARVRRRRLGGRVPPPPGPPAPGRDLVPDHLPAGRPAGRRRVRGAGRRGRAGPRRPRPGLPERLEHGRARGRRPGRAAHLRPAQRHPAHPRRRQHPGPRGAVRRRDGVGARDGAPGTAGRRGRRGAGGTGRLPGRRR